MLGSSGHGVAIERLKRWARAHVPGPARGLAADLGFLLEVAVSRMSIDRHRRSLGSDDIDAEALCRHSEMADHVRLADEYFGAGLNGEPRESSTRAHLLKPFHDPVDAANHLAAFSSLIHGLQLSQSSTVLDFGCGAGWTSRLLMQLGCRVLLCDVSQAALDSARAGIERHPPIVPPGTPDPEFLLFDGHHLELADGSVDRVFCFDAFHHVPNQPEVIRELGRVLTVDGVAGFHEPGPDHSRTAASQFEMRSHGFLERDLLLGPIWASAQQAGFTKLELSLVAPPLSGLGLRRYERVLRAGSVPLAFRRRLWHSAATTRLFFLVKGGTPVPAPDSRHADGLAATIDVEHRALASSDGGLEVGVRVANTGRNRWLPSGQGRGSVHLGAHELDADRHMVDLDAARFDLPGDGLQPGESVQLTVTLPPLTPGHQFELDLVSDGITWFTKRGSPGCTVS